MPPRRSSRRAAVPEPQMADDIEVVDPAPAAEDEYAPIEQAPAAELPAASGRRSRAGRSSRRSAVSGRSSNARLSARQPISAEERARRRAALATTLKTVIGVLLLVAALGGAWWFLLRKDERAIAATAQLQTVDNLVREIDTGLWLKEPRQAEAARAQALEIITKSAELGYGAEVPDPNNANLSPRHAERAARLRIDLEGSLRQQVEKAERDQQVKLNVQRISAGLAALAKMSDADLAIFEKDLQDFLDNPVLPSAGPNDQHQAQYQSEVQAVKVQRGRLEDEKKRRNEAITDLPVREARLKANGLVQQERFKEALALIDDLQRQYATADFRTVRQFVLDAAEGSWRAASAMADENYRTYTQPGVTAAMAKTSLAAARSRMEQVIERFGIDDYVAKARAALARYVE